MNSFEQNYKSVEDLIFMNKSLFFEKDVDFNFELSPGQILSEVTDFESLHTQMFDQKKENVSYEVFIEVFEEKYFLSNFAFKRLVISNLFLQMFLVI